MEFDFLDQFHFLRPEWFMHAVLAEPALAHQLGDLSTRQISSAIGEMHFFCGALLVACCTSNWIRNVQKQHETLPGSSRAP